jgi:hypothetical protein
MTQKVRVTAGTLLSTSMSSDFVEVFKADYSFDDPPFPT